MKYICSLITVSDIKHSRDFYENILNQKVKFDFGENITFHGDFAIHLLTHEYELYQIFQGKISECDKQIQRLLNEQINNDDNKRQHHIDSNSSLL